MRAHAMLFLLILPGVSAGAGVLCPRPADCTKEPLAVQDEYAAHIVLRSGDGDFKRWLFPLFEAAGIAVLDVDVPEQYLLLQASDGNRILGGDQTLDDKRRALQRLIDENDVDATVELLEPNHYVRGEGQCVPFQPPDDARWLVGLPQIASIGAGDGTVVVAVLDSGTQVGHSSFGERLWTNPGEQPGNADGDRNGIDGDYYGASFERGVDGADVSAKSSHGMMVAGVVNARHDKGPAGIAPRARVMTLRFLNKFDVGKTWDAARAIGYAAKEGAEIINMSWTTSCKDSRLERAVTKAASTGPNGILMVAAAGNHSSAYDDDNDRCKLYPASYALPTMIAVGATDAEGCERADSRYGKTTVHLSAPGSDVWTTDRNDQCAQFGGTSAAAPFVTGAAAVLAGLTPSWNWAARRRYLLDSVQKPPGSCTLTTQTGGIVSLVRATAAPVSVKRPSIGEVVDRLNARIEWDLAFRTTLCAKLDIYYAKDGQTYAAIKTDVAIKPTNGNVALPPEPTTQAKIRIVCRGTSLYAESSAFVVP